MLRYIGKRLFFLLITLLVIVALQTIIIQSLPGAPDILEWYSNSHSENQLGKMLENTHHVHVHATPLSEDPAISIPNKPSDSGLSYFTDAVVLLKNLFLLNWGESTLFKQPVRTLVQTRLGFSLVFTLIGLSVSYLMGAIFGCVQNSRRKSHFIFAIVEGMPTAIISILLLLLFASRVVFDFFPLGGLPEKEGPYLFYLLNVCYHLFLPLLALILSSLVPVIYIWQAAFEEAYKMPFISTLRSLGFSEKYIFWQHILKNAVYPVLAKFPHHMVKTMFKGALVIEILFNLDGVGRLGFEALLGRDYPLMFALLYLYALLNIVFTLCSDVLLFRLDRRVTLWEKQDA